MKALGLHSRNKHRSIFPQSCINRDFLDFALVVLVSVLYILPGIIAGDYTWRYMLSPHRGPICSGRHPLVCDSPRQRNSAYVIVECRWRRDSLYMSPRALTISFTSLRRARAYGSVNLNSAAPEPREAGTTRCLYDRSVSVLYCTSTACLVLFVTIIHAV